MSADRSKAFLASKKDIQFCKTKGDTRLAGSRAKRRHIQGSHHLVQTTKSACLSTFLGDNSPSAHSRTCYCRPRSERSAHRNQPARHQYTLAERNVTHFLSNNHDIRCQGIQSFSQLSPGLYLVRHKVIGTGSRRKDGVRGIVEEIRGVEEIVFRRLHDTGRQGVERDHIRNQMRSRVLL
jgi:hypothetical protein